jgi:hypothetical protein
MFTKLADAVADRIIIKLAQLQEYQAQLAAAAEIQEQQEKQAELAKAQQVEMESNQALIKQAAQQKLLNIIKQAEANKNAAAKQAAAKQAEAKQAAANQDLVKKAAQKKLLKLIKQAGAADVIKKVLGKGKAGIDQVAAAAQPYAEAGINNLGSYIDAGAAKAKALGQQIYNDPRFYAGLGGAGIGLAGGLGLNALLNRDN